MIRKILILLLIGILVWSIGAKYISQHEFIHQQIFLRHGINSITHINYITLNGVTIPERSCIDCSLENTLNDVIGYNVALIIYAAVILIMVYFIFNKFKSN